MPGDVRFGLLAGHVDAEDARDLLHGGGEPIATVHLAEVFELGHLADALGAGKPQRIAEVVAALEMLAGRLSPESLRH